ncbi:MAG TPA: hypothetical protein VE987_17055 [Polyangiaceae bacterium]|nr:hypothetical protein [Polyangiaceae bacterium]
MQGRWLAATTIPMALACLACNSAGTACASAGGVCVAASSTRCALAAQVGAQDCSTNPSNPGASICCIAFVDAGQDAGDASHDAPDAE